jgi:hypothetical protein
MPGQIGISARPVALKPASRCVKRLVRTIELNGSSQDEQTIATGGTFQQFTITDLVIPDNVDEVVFRVGHVDQAGVDPGRIFVACPQMNEGLAPTTVGDIFSVLYADAQVERASDRRAVSGRHHHDATVHA